MSLQWFVTNRCTPPPPRALHVICGRPLIEPNFPNLISISTGNIFDSHSFQQNSFGCKKVKIVTLIWLNIRPGWVFFLHLPTSRSVLIRILIQKLNYLWRRCLWNLITFPKPVLELKSINAFLRYTIFLTTTPSNSINSTLLWTNGKFRNWCFETVICDMICNQN